MRVLVSAALALVGTVPPGWHALRAHGLTVRYPPGWYATAHRLTPVTYPPQVLAVASYPLPRNAAGADGCEPKEALERMPTDGAFIFGWEYVRRSQFAGLRVREFRPRPAHFRLRGFARYECFGPSYLLRFRDRGRLFQVHVAFGRHADARMRATAVRILDRLVVSG